MLYSTLSAGKGGVRLSLDVAKEGVIARVMGSGIVGTMAPPLKRARASVAEIFVGIVAFLGAATVLSHYVERWREFPTSAAVERTLRFIGPEWRSVQRTIQGRSLSPAQRYAAQRPYRLEVQEQMHHAYSHTASGAPVVFDQIVQVSLDAAVVGLAALVVVGFIGGVRSLPRERRTRLILPGVVLGVAGGLLILREIASRSNWVPYGFWLDIQAVFHGRIWAWRTSVAYSLSPLFAIMFLAIGGAMLLSRSELGVHMCRWVGRLAIGTGAFLGVALVCTLAWAMTLSSQAPGYLFWSHQGLFGNSLVSVFVVTVLVMAGASGLVIAGCTRCLRTKSFESA